METNKEKLQQQKAEANDLAVKLQSDLDFETNILNELKDNRHKTKEKTQALEKKLSTSHENILEQIEELKSIYIEKLNEQAAKRNEKQSLKHQHTQLKEKKKKHNNKQQNKNHNKKKL